MKESSHFMKKYKRKILGGLVLLLVILAAFFTWYVNDDYDASARALAALNTTEQVVILVFIIGIFILCYLSKRLASVPMIGEVVERYEKAIVPVVFIGLGIFILLENGTIQHLWSLIG